MQKKTIFFIALFIIGISLPIIYWAYAPARPTLDGVFGNVIPWATDTFNYVWTSFQAIPYWPVFLLGGGILFGIGFDRYWQAVWQRMHFWGYDKAVERFRTRPSAAPPQTIRPTPNPAEALPLEEERTEIEAQ